MSVDLFFLLLIPSTISTMILTEAMKRLLVATDSPHRDNIVARISCVTASTGVGVIYRIPFGLGFSAEQLYRLIVLMFFSWMTSMVLYDKIIQTIEQHKRYKIEKGDE